MSLIEEEDDGLLSNDDIVLEEDLANSPSKKTDK